jgi:hypothetical protein
VWLPAWLPSGVADPHVLWPREDLLSPQDLTVVAERELASGERWYLKAGGSADDYYTLMETVHSDGRRDEGGMGGPVLYPGRLLNVYEAVAQLPEGLCQVGHSTHTTHDLIAGSGRPAIFRARIEG